MDPLETEGARNSILALAEMVAYPAVQEPNPSPVDLMYPARPLPRHIDDQVTVFAVKHVTPEHGPSPNDVADFIETLGVEALPAVASGMLMRSTWVDSKYPDLMRAQLELAALRTKQALEFHAAAKQKDIILPKPTLPLLNIRVIGSFLTQLALAGHQSAEGTSRR
ncbi:hypothetical protein M1555_03870 [Patescibacteria group bacterium]|nr:hypothetical protein [Patescibacteria group bacterium]